MNNPLPNKNFSFENKTRNKTMIKQIGIIISAKFTNKALPRIETLPNLPKKIDEILITSRILNM